MCFLQKVTADELCQSLSEIRAEAKGNIGKIYLQWSC